MRLKVVTPSAVIVNEEVLKVVAEARNGLFCLLPLHIDFVAPLIPSILSFTPLIGGESFLAVDEGILVKCGNEVLVSSWNAVGGPLGELKQAMQKQFQDLSEREQKARSALSKLEANMVHQILEWNERAHA